MCGFLEINALLRFGFSSEKKKSWKFLFLFLWVHVMAWLDKNVHLEKSCCSSWLKWERLPSLIRFKVLQRQQTEHKNRIQYKLLCSREFFFFFFPAACSHPPHSPWSTDMFEETYGTIPASWQLVLLEWDLAQAGSSYPRRQKILRTKREKIKHTTLLHSA